ncbi:MAG: Mur ligase domain-containing protein, partial [Myxococcota bacterium]|nr:Mur ligase domain-containing protein [Myxococcota bacterium]
MSTPEHVETDAEARRPPAPVDWHGVRRVHVMGICGSAMGAFAGMLRRRGYDVRGSDRGAYPPMSTTLRDMGIEIMEGYQASNLDWGPDVVVVGNVIRPGYEEAIALRRSRIPHCSLPQALGALFIDGCHSVVVTGTHGKTTTSAMTAWLLEVAGLEPGFMIGGVTGNFGTNHRVSDGGVFVVEGDEYDTAYFDKGPKFLHYRPQTASVNNIEF